jgi:hypothetical protein
MNVCTCAHIYIYIYIGKRIERNKKMKGGLDGAVAKEADVSFQWSNSTWHIRSMTATDCL